MMRACALARDSASPRSTSKTSKRTFGIGLLYCHQVKYSHAHRSDQNHAPASMDKERLCLLCVDLRQTIISSRGIYKNAGGFLFILPDLQRSLFAQRYRRCRGRPSAPSKEKPSHRIAETS